MHAFYTTNLNISSSSVYHRSFKLEWDTVASFDSGSSNTSLGAVQLPAYVTLCRSCVSKIDFFTNLGDGNARIYYNTSSDNTIKLLTTGSRIVLPLTSPEDNRPYLFEVANHIVSSNMIMVKYSGLRFLEFTNIKSLL